MLIKTRLLVLLIGMISCVGFGQAKPDLSQNSEKFACYSIELINGEIIKEVNTGSRSNKTVYAVTDAKEKLKIELVPWQVKSLPFYVKQFYNKRGKTIRVVFHTNIKDRALKSLSETVDKYSCYSVVRIEGKIIKEINTGSRSTKTVYVFTKDSQKLKIELVPWQVQRLPFYIKQFYNNRGKPIRTIYHNNIYKK